MRTSTVVFLVLFLAFHSSSERRSQLRHLAGGGRDVLHQITDPHGSEADDEDDRDCRPESPETRLLRSQLRDVEKRESLAKKSLRTVDRAVRALEERARAVEQDARRDPQFADIYAANLSSLRGQIGQMEREKVEIESLRETLRSNAVALQSQIDLAGIRDERKAVEAFLDRERVSPVERLANRSGW